MEEETRRLKSRATWIKMGEFKTKIFHSYENNRRNINTIWELEVEYGKIVSSTKDLKIATSSYFSSLFNDLGSSNISS